MELYRATVVTLRAVTVIVCVCVQSLNHVSVFGTQWTVAFQAPLSMGFPRQEYWSGLPFLSPGDRPGSGIEPSLLHWQADSLPLSHQLSPGDSHEKNIYRGLSPCPHPLPLLHPGRCSPAPLVLYDPSFCHVMFPVPGGALRRSVIPRPHTRIQRF